MIHFKKVLGCFVIVMLLLISFTANSSTAYSEEEFVVNVDIGFKGFYKYTYNTPISVEIKNNSRDINGKIQLLFEEGYTDKKLYTAYTKDLNIAKGATKVIDMDLVFESHRTNAMVRILDDRDKVVWEKKFNMNTGKSTSTVGIGVLSNDVDSLRYLTLVNFLKTNNNKDSLTSSIADLDEVMPEQASYLDVLDVIVINNYDTEKLNDNQEKALKQWVDNGGTLVIGTGPNYNRTLKGLGNINNMSVQGTSFLDNFNQVLSPSGEVFDTDVPLPIAVGAFSGGKELLKHKDSVLAYENQLGNGRIIFTAFDLGLSPFKDWNGRIDFIKNLLSEKIRSNSSSGADSQKFFNSNRFFNTVQYIPKDKMPSMKFVFILIGIFIIAVGPINYIVLKKLDKREKAWFSIPAIVLLFTLVMYVWGLGTSFKNPLMNNISIITLDDLTQKASIKTVSGILGFTKGDIDITTSGKAILNTSATFRDSMNYANFVNGDVVLEYDLQKERHIIFKKRGTWDTQAINFQEVKSLDEGYTQDIKIKDGTLIGSLQNNTSINLEDAFILYGLDFYKLGDISKGESKNINLNLNKQSSSAKNVGKDFYRVLDNLYPWNYSNRNSTSQDILDNNTKRDILDGYFWEVFNQGNNNNILLFAWNTEPISSDININGEKPERIDRNLIIIPININYEKGEQVQIPFGALLPEVVEINGLHPEIPERRFYGEGYAVFSIKSDDSISFEQIDIDITNGYPIKNYNASIFNFQTNQWEKYNTTNLTIDNSNRNQYYDDNLGVKIMIETTENNSVEMPAFSIKGVAK
ncbi:hypothetical protein [Brassicibacter mesophilus]|uniref:hypothetical protein n=1 Tax=Brassicibacter mesophilus TaxID=745119 RepID=UPI003D2620B6